MIHVFTSSQTMMWQYWIQITQVPRVCVTGSGLHINQSTNQPINHSINPSINRSIDRPIDKSISQSVSQTVSQSIHPSLFVSVILPRNKLTLSFNLLTHKNEKKQGYTRTSVWTRLFCRLPHLFIKTSITNHDIPSSSAIAQGPRDTQSQLKYCRLLHNGMKNKTAFEKAWNRWITWNVTQGHRKWRYAISHISHPVIVVSNNNVSILDCFWDITTYTV